MAADPRRRMSGLSRPVLLGAVLALGCVQSIPAPGQVRKAAATLVAEDWPALGRYRADNEALAKGPRPRTVFMGDSITQGWIDKAPAFFGPGRLDRGIGGQTTPQMLLRFRQDVIELRPQVVQIMGGTNDIAGNTGPMTAEQTLGNIMSMTELAQAHGIRVIIASIPPAGAFPWRPGLATGPKIVALNARLKSYAARTGATYADYWSTLRDPGSKDGQAMRAALTYDGVHPNEAGYRVMAPIAEAAIKAALARPAPVSRTGRP